MKNFMLFTIILLGFMAFNLFITNIQPAFANKIAADLTYKSSKYPSLSQLRTSGNKIYDADGNEVILKGVWLGDGVADDQGDNYSVNTLLHLKNSWNVNHIRIPIHPGTWVEEPDYLPKYVDKLVDGAGQAGIYIIVGWHAHGNPNTGQEEPGWTFGNPELSLAKSGLKAIVTRYKDKEWVLYDTLNEPCYISWREWRPLAEELTDTVHAVNPRALVLVSGVNWSHDLSGALNDPVNRDNIIYEVHAYPGNSNSVGASEGYPEPSGIDWKTAVRSLSQTTPCMIGEWGWDQSPDISDHTSGTADNYALPLLQFAEEIGIGWSAWIYSTSGAPSLVDYKNFDLSLEIPTEAGCVVKNFLNNAPHPDDLSNCNKTICSQLPAAIFKDIEISTFTYRKSNYVFNLQSSDYNQLYLEIEDPSHSQMESSISFYKFKISYFESTDSLSFEFRENEGITDITANAKTDEYGKGLFINVLDTWADRIKVLSMAKTDQIILKGILKNISDMIVNLMATDTNMSDADKAYWKGKAASFQAKTDAFSKSLDAICNTSSDGDTSNRLTQTQVSQLYVSLFGRASEGEGNAYWQANQTDMTDAASAMLATEAAKSYFGDKLNEDQAFIEFIYENTLGKTYTEDPDGVDYWVGELATGKSKGQIITTLINAAMDPQYTGLSAQNQFINKVTVSNYTADNIARCPDVNDLSAFVEFISGVTHDPATVEAAKDVVDVF